MKYLLRCLACGATCWAHGVYESDTNALVIDDDKPLEWEPANECPHDEYEAIDEEPIDPD